MSFVESLIYGFKSIKSKNILYGAIVAALAFVLGILGIIGYLIWVLLLTYFNRKVAEKNNLVEGEMKGKAYIYAIIMYFVPALISFILYIYSLLSSGMLLTSSRNINIHLLMGDIIISSIVALILQIFLYYPYGCAIVGKEGKIKEIKKSLVMVCAYIIYNIIFMAPVALLAAYVRYTSINTNLSSLVLIFPIIYISMMLFMTCMMSFIAHYSKNN